VVRCNPRVPTLFGMVIFSGLLTGFGRLIGAVATMTVAWATILMFGRVPESRRTLLSFMTLGSLAWLVALGGVLIPSVGAFLLAAVPKVAFVEDWWLRLVMVGLAALLPLAIGIASVHFIAPETQPKGRARVDQTLRGYLYTAVYAFTIVFLAAWGLARKIRSLQKGWESAHIPVIIKPGHYDAVVDDLDDALREADLPVDRRAAAGLFEVPLRLLAWAGGRPVADQIPKRLIALTSGDLEVLVYPSDIALLGPKDLVQPARAAVARRLGMADTYLTAALEAEQIEDRLAELARKAEVTAADFVPVDELLNTIESPYDEWETLLRLRLQVERERRLPAAKSLAQS
jgi:hypothetical protein